MNEISPQVREQMEIDTIYAGYTHRQEEDVAAFRKEEGLILPADLDYAALGSLSTEIRQKLERVRPATLGAAARIPGVTPAAIVSLLRFVKRKSREGKAA
jgi:tRNA uridine 5-carboxymethylaminomethyl modification enzyme